MKGIFVLVALLRVSEAFRAAWRPHRGLSATWRRSALSMRVESETELIARVSAEVMKDSGVELDQLLNPSKVISLERDLGGYREELTSCTDDKRASELKEGLISLVISGFLAYGEVPFFGKLDLVFQALGFWGVWLFTIPSLRARKPAEKEKEALNVAFLATPLTNLGMPFLTKDTFAVYVANVAVMAGCYLYAFTLGSSSRSSASVNTIDIAEEGNPEGTSPRDESPLAKSLKKVVKALDYGSGQERGYRKSK